MPVPVTVSTVAEPEPLLKEIFALAEPLDWGANFTPNEILRPATNVTGSDNPVTLNSELLEVAEETVTFDPAAASEALKLLLVPTATLPKLIVVGLIVSCPAAAPVAESGILSVDSDESTEILPVAWPADLGAKLT